ncbi:hypothetical protein [Massilia sp. DD77]|uniref:hypothetical protein n=1 Tax=Massilia sp. DD77 TaxID=3109349 RepID=UPI0030001771
MLTWSMMRPRLFLPSLALFLVGTAVNAAEQMTVLNLPLGGKLPQPIRVCKPQGLTDKEVKAMCWISAPFAYKGRKSGMVDLPGRDQRPRWAANATFNISVGPDNTLSKINVTSFNGQAQTEIRNSISSRFGPPLPNPGGIVEWKRSDIYIRSYCSPAECRTEFLSPVEYAEWQGELDARKKKDLARPVAP